MLCTGRVHLSGIGYLCLLIASCVSGACLGCTPSPENAIAAAEEDIAMYQSAISLYTLDNMDLLPQTLNALVAGPRMYLKEIVLDPWGNPYHYEIIIHDGREAYSIFSYGPDGAPKNSDDIVPEFVHAN